MEQSRSIISYSLYGNNRRYTAPLLINAEIAGRLFPGWTIYVYHDETVSVQYLSQLKQYGIVTINIDKIDNKKLPPKMWRFLPTASPNVESIIFRDADSLLTQRERDLVIKWMQSDKSVHIIRDHPLHVAPILAGMFGMKKDSFRILSTLLESKTPDVHTWPHDYDQVFLADHFYPKIKEAALIHVSFFQYWGESVIKIDPVAEGNNFIGAVFHEDEANHELNKMMMKSGFINGIPYSMARIMRYRVRPIIYTSKLFQFLRTSLIS